MRRFRGPRTCGFCKGEALFAVALWPGLYVPVCETCIREAGEDPKDLKAALPEDRARRLTALVRRLRETRG